MDQRQFNPDFVKCTAVSREAGNALQNAKNAIDPVTNGVF